MSLLTLLLLVIIAAVCGAVGKPQAGERARRSAVIHLVSRRR